MTTKICNTCKVEKNITEFYKSGTHKNGTIKYRGDCKMHHTKFHIDKEYQKKYQKLYRAKNKDKRLDYNKQYRKDNKEFLIQNAKLYRQNNKEILNQDKKRYNKEKRRINSSFKLRANISTSVGTMLRLVSSTKKSNSILQFLPYTIELLKLYIESLFEYWMTWKNWGVYNKKTWNDNDPTTWKWNLDHIIPHSTFKYTSMDCQEFKDCWALSNLRPYSAKLNLSDGALRKRHL